MASTELTISFHADMSMATDALLFSLERMTLQQRRAFARWFHNNRDVAFDLNPVWNDGECLAFPQPSDRCWHTLDEIKERVR